MLSVISDTHQTEKLQLPDRVLESVRSAEIVIHAGDFTSDVVRSQLEREATTLIAVHGNVDDAAVCDALPDRRTFTWNGARIAITHTHRSGVTGLRMYGLERHAHLVIFGHSHRGVVHGAEPTLVNPGSPTSPRGNVPSFVEVRTVDRGLQLDLLTTVGDPIQSEIIDL